MRHRGSRKAERHNRSTLQGANGNICLDKNTNARVRILFSREDLQQNRLETFRSVSAPPSGFDMINITLTGAGCCFKERVGKESKSAYLKNTQHFSQAFIFFKAVQSHLYSISNSLSNLNNTLRAKQHLIFLTTFDERLINKETFFLWTYP